MIFTKLASKNLLVTCSRCFSSSIKLNRLITIKSNDEFLNKVMNSDNPVIVNFHAEWCEPCHILTPKMKELIEHDNNIDLAIVDVEDHAELVHTFEVKAVPAVIAIRNGLVVDKFIGLVDANMIESLISKLSKKVS
ncbi:thioredoxin, mitochondrial [Tribolium madens]|uniref:thioredoxin, mitochondrial n=1 Tax=Tribolium madens TaxID=41895 RepID=UPI001CF738CA|nr:thioredoxin, mitochondrial [Tribolium madens]